MYLFRYSSQPIPPPAWLPTRESAIPAVFVSAIPSDYLRDVFPRLLRAARAARFWIALIPSGGQRVVLAPLVVSTQESLVTILTAIGPQVDSPKDEPLKETPSARMTHISAATVGATPLLPHDGAFRAGP